MGLGFKVWGVRLPRHIASLEPNFDARAHPSFGFMSVMLLTLLNFARDPGFMEIPKP